MTLGIIFITNVVLGYTSYILDVVTDIKFTLSMFTMKFTTNITDNPGFAYVGTLTNIDQSILAVQEKEQFFYAGIISAAHVIVSLLMSSIFFVCMEWGRFSKKSLCRIPIPIVTKTVGFYLEYQKLRLRRQNRSSSRDAEMKRIIKEIEAHSDWINLSLMVEAAYEAGMGRFHSK